MYHNRDMGINYIKIRKNHACYGMGIGIMVLDDAYPGFPGDVRNAAILIMAIAATASTIRNRF